MLRVDVAGPDAYPANALKNYAIPTSNPLPTYNAANPGSPIAGLGEAYLTGLRNVYRASFDRANGDLWMGDVGEVFVEEVSFLKAGTNVSGPPADLGWPQREGTLGSDVPGAPESLVNPFTAVTALQPLQQFVHDGGGEAVIGGYVYRGPVAELQGKYFYSDFVTTGNANQIWMLEFDRNTPTANYNGNNGTRTDVSCAVAVAGLSTRPTRPTCPTRRPARVPGWTTSCRSAKTMRATYILSISATAPASTANTRARAWAKSSALCPISQITVTIRSRYGRDDLRQRDRAMHRHSRLHARVSSRVARTGRAHADHRPARRPTRRRWLDRPE